MCASEIRSLAPRILAYETALGMAAAPIRAADPVRKVLRSVLVSDLLIFPQHHTLGAVGQEMLAYLDVEMGICCPLMPSIETVNPALRLVFKGRNLAGEHPTRVAPIAKAPPAEGILRCQLSLTLSVRRGLEWIAHWHPDRL